MYSWRTVINNYKKLAKSPPEQLNWSGCQFLQSETKPAWDSVGVGWWQAYFIKFQVQQYLNLNESQFSVQIAFSAYIPQTCQWDEMSCSEMKNSP